MFCFSRDGLSVGLFTHYKMDLHGGVSRAKKQSIKFENDPD